ncbi:hypothetical protein SKAU_G00204680 [Synaphobranchus kaupii]|uniref:Uncharacterized protein n=1 Tax=Synaphobranchus kaupii TaxID=118154 RepID=A0A9Q1FG70_SYNKA|nr:hypothetical protein SKAU_G00204680 [Synaphobranchus kaupii]
MGAKAGSAHQEQQTYFSRRMRGPIVRAHRALAKRYMQNNPATSTTQGRADPSARESELEPVLPSLGIRNILPAPQIPSVCTPLM